MKDHSLKIALPAVLVLAGIMAGCSVNPQPDTVAADTPPSQQLPFAEGKAPVVPANTDIYVRLQQPISSATTQAGQSFTAVLDEPLEVDGQTLAPAGATVTGAVVAARESGHVNSAGYVRITLSSITLNNKIVPLQTNSVFVSGGSYKKRNLAFIGGGAGGGALLGALLNGDKSAGTTAAYASGKKEVGFMADRRLGFRLAQPLNTM
jgi:hypothetical protein